MSSGSCSYPGEFKPTPQVDTNRNVPHKFCVDHVTSISTDMPTKVTGGILGHNKSSVTHAQVVSDKTGFLSESTNTTHASRNVLLSRHPDMHQNTKAVVPALSGDGKRRVKKDRNLEKEQSGGDLLAAASKWAQFITPEEGADSSDGDASESELSTFQDYNENIPNISGCSNQQRYTEERSHNMPVTSSRNISDNLRKPQHCPNFSLSDVGDDDDDDLDAMIADWPVA